LHPSVSIIVPVFNDEERLGGCLERLAAQTYPRDKYEVIVADNGSARDIRALVSRFPRTRLVVERKPGSYAARNAGLAIASGEIVGFTDSDCIPRVDWIERGVAALSKNHDVGLTGGRVILFHRNPRKLSLGEFYQEICGFPQQIYLETQRFAVTANLFMWRKVLDDVGHFHGDLKSAGDKEWGKRVFAAGYRQSYADDAIVEHPSRPSAYQVALKRMRTAGGILETRKINAEDDITFLDDFRRLWPIRFSQLDRFGDHPLMQSSSNRALFLSIDFMMQMAELVEIVRLRLGGSPRRQ
jgi:glycosyltransferase involved in cell wall biosynthesis